MTTCIAAIDQGTTSTRCMLFDRMGGVLAVAQKEHEQIFPEPGWVEHDPLEIWERTQEVIRSALKQSTVTAEEIAAIGKRDIQNLWSQLNEKLQACIAA